MSRIGRAPIVIPAGVTVNVEENHVIVRGKLGELYHPLPGKIGLTIENNIIHVTRSDDSRAERALHGLTRALIANMVTGVSTGFTRDLEIVGVGYRVEQRGVALQFALGYSHKTVVIPPEGITLKAKTLTALSITGIDKQLVGDTAARIRSLRPPEPYKGKGIRYAKEAVRRKAGKTAGK